MKRTSVSDHHANTGRHFADHLSDSCDGLGHGLRVEANGIDERRNHASGYSPQADGWRLVPESSDYAGNAGMMASARDLLLWANNFADARVGTPELLARMQTATVLTGGQTTQSGMGFAIGSYRGARTLRTSGGDFGVSTELVLYPDRKVAVAVLCNMDSVVMGGLATVHPTELTNGVADVFFDDVLEPRPELPPTTGATASAGTTPPPPVSLSADELASKTGLYRLGLDENQIVSMSVRDGRLTAWDFWGDNYPMLMTPSAQTDSRFPAPRSSSRQPTVGGLSHGTSSTATDVDCWSFRWSSSRFRRRLSHRSSASTEAMNWTRRTPS